MLPACVLLFEAFGSMCSSGSRFRDSFAACYYAGFERLSGLCFAGFEAFGSAVPRLRFREAQKSVFVDSKGNVKEFTWLGFWPFSARVHDGV